MQRVKSLVDWLLGRLRRHCEVRSFLMIQNFGPICPGPFGDESSLHWVVLFRFWSKITILNICHFFVACSPRWWSTTSPDWSGTDGRSQIVLIGNIFIIRMSVTAFVVRLISNRLCYDVYFVYQRTPPPVSFYSRAPFMMPTDELYFWNFEILKFWDIFSRFHRN